MIRIKKFTIITLFFITLMGCSLVNTKIDNQSFMNSSTYDEAYSIILQEIEEDALEAAIKHLKLLIKYYSLVENYSQQLLLDLIYAYYKHNDFSQAEQTIIHFMKLYPKNPNIDYVLYMKGVIEMINAQSMLGALFHTDDTECDQSSNKMALEDFSKLLLEHPNSFYAKDTYKRFVYLKNYLANHEYAIVRFYFDHKSYISVINRVEHMLRDYSDTKATRYAIFFLRDSYSKLHLTTQLKQIDRLIEINHLTRPIKTPIGYFLHQYTIGWDGKFLY